MASHIDFVDVVAAERGLLVTRADDHNCRLEPRDSALAWHCDLDDGTPTDSERDPASFVRWVCPTLRVGGLAPEATIPRLDVRRRGPQSDLGKLFRGLGRLTGREAPRPSGGKVEGRFIYTDPAGILDGGLRQRLESWPAARHGDGVVRPAELWSIAVTSEGLVVESVSWWGSAPALDHQIGLALEIAHLLADRR